MFWPTMARLAKAPATAWSAALSSIVSEHDLDDDAIETAVDEAINDFFERRATP